MGDFRRQLRSGTLSVGFAELVLLGATAVDKERMDGDGDGADAEECSSFWLLDR